MNEQELRDTLRRLAGHCHHLESELHDAPLQATRYSQVDSHQSHGGPRPPTNLTQLNYILEEAQPIITGWATNLASSARLTGLPTGQPLATWCAWLSRHRLVLLEMDWADDAVVELQELETQLRHHIHPNDPHEIKLPDYATADEIAQALGKTPSAVRKWATRHHVTAYTQGGKVHYRTCEITTKE